MKVQDLFNSPKPVADGSIPSASTKCTSSITANVSAFQAEEVGSTPIWCSIWRYRIIVVQRSLTPLEVERNHLPLPVEIKSNKSKRRLQQLY